MVEKQKGKKHRYERTCKTCAFSDYNEAYALWYCEKYEVYPADFDYRADICEGYCRYQTKMRHFDEEV